MAARCFRAQEPAAPSPRAAHTYCIGSPSRWPRAMASLQVASTAIRLYSKVHHIPDESLGIVKDSHSTFCMGRRVRQVPIWLIVIAARNQFNYIEGQKLHVLSLAVFEWLATRHGLKLTCVI